MHAQTIDQPHLLAAGPEEIQATREPRWPLLVIGFGGLLTVAWNGATAWLLIRLAGFF